MVVQMERKLSIVTGRGVERCLRWCFTTLGKRSPSNKPLKCKNEWMQIKEDVKMDVYEVVKVKTRVVVPRIEKKDPKLQNTTSRVNTRWNSFVCRTRQRALRGLLVPLAGNPNSILAGVA